MSIRRWAPAALPALLLTLAACVGPAPTTEDYLGKARHSADSAVSALQTALLAVDSNRKGNLFAAYLDVLLSEAEDDFGSVQQQFDSIQPPHTDRADRIRSQLDTLLSKGSDTLSQLRILERRDESRLLVKTAAGIPPLVDKLTKLAQGTLQ
ncbi:MAG TPA: hypothetical protein VJ831_05820 [Jatrophihabitantaceae bacterium]|nr:hypothetical protein [Jatrophihabitantaceae bacterium]